jgi:hypothetical protein
MLNTELMLQLNSSLEACPEPDQQIKKESGEPEMDWPSGHRVRAADFAATSRSGINQQPWFCVRFSQIRKIT